MGRFSLLGLPSFLYAFTFDTTRTLVNLLCKGVFERCPHTDGTLPFVSYRTSLLTVTPAVAQQLVSPDWTRRSPRPSG
ncbi:hypothetical protein [Streptomyces sp. STR69]|uniref:hypothetical protein n=1 Tax=Streptomyces sp. STR69 TaxID=1796942 RepID=UPI0021C9E9B0|nr:hypothetical protein [Streptomyces sp. STR69]